MIEIITTKKMVKYVHDEEHHNLIAPSIIVPFLVDTIKPTSVVDLGCGIGTFLNIFNKEGINDVLGIDGEWVDKTLLSKYIRLEDFLVADLEKPLNVTRRYDMAICLEVAEHLNEVSARTIVNNLVMLSDVIVFSAAFPGQGGQNHLNEQWPTYWKALFSEYNCTFNDVLRPIFWDNEQIPDWYKQNMFLIIKRGHEEQILNNIKHFNKEPILNSIHPNYYKAYLEETKRLNKYQNKYYNLLKGKAGIGTNMKIMVKYLLRKVNVYTK